MFDYNAAQQTEGDGVTTIRVVMFDWGDTVMRNLPGSTGPMAVWPRVEAVPGIAEALSILHPHHHLLLATNAEDSGAGLVRAALARVGAAIPM